MTASKIAVIIFIFKKFSKSIDTRFESDNILVSKDEKEVKTNMANENNTITRSQLEQALAEWCLQWTTEFISEHVLPNVNKALENEVVIFDLINWKKLNDRYQMEKKAEFIKSINTGKNEFTKPIINDRRRYGDNLYDYFAKICK